MTYAEKLKDPRWQRKRLEVFKRDSFACRLCDETDLSLCVHHKKYKRNPWDSPLEDLTTLCEDCHERVEEAKAEFSKLVATRIHSTPGFAVFTIINRILASEHGADFLSLSMIYLEPSTQKALSAVVAAMQEAYKAGKENR